MFPLDTEILVVDDMKGIRVWLIKTLQTMGYTKLSEAVNGQEALEILKTKKIGLVFTDIVMPVKTGIELLQDMKADPKMASIPTIVLSAETDREMIVASVKLGASTYIIKPATLPVLQKKMEEAFTFKK